MPDNKFKIDNIENPLGISWNDSTFIANLSPHNVLDYFSSRSNPFYDNNCNNEYIKMQNLSQDHLQNMPGIEYCLLHVQEPILYIIRKQERKSPSQVFPICDYYIIAGTVYQAPDILSVINTRILNTVGHMQSAFDEARKYSRYHPSKNYWWDFGKSMSEADKIKEEKRKKRQEKKNKKHENEKRIREEPSSKFQRQKVDYILDIFTQKFPHKIPQQLQQLPPPPPSSQAPSVSGTDTKDDIKPDKEGTINTSKDNEKSENLKRDASGFKISGQEAKRAKVEN